MDYYSLFWGPGLISTIDKPRGAFMCRSSTPAVLAGSNPFRGLLLTVLGSQRDFRDRRTPRCVYVSVINTRSFWPNLTSFVDYYSLFWGPGVISTIDEPRGAFMCRSSTPVVLVDSDQFRGLLLTVLGSWRDFHDRRNPRCVYVSVINTRSFWPNLTRFVDYYSLFWAPGVISTIDEPRGAFMCRSSAPAVFAGSNPFRGLLLTVSGSWTYFHD